jgi:putative transposase
MRRKRNRLPRQSYVGRHWYFITICTEGRRPDLSNGPLVANLLDCLKQKCRVQRFGVYAYCFMPDHLHLELVGLSDSSSLGALLKGFKGGATSLGRSDGIRNLWEKGFYDHVLREGEEENAVAWYIFNNPVRKGLVKDPRDWPYSGSWMFDWKKAVTPPDPFVPPW